MIIQWPKLPLYAHLNRQVTWLYLWDTINEG